VSPGDKEEVLLTSAVLFNDWHDIEAFQEARAEALQRIENRQTAWQAKVAQLVRIYENGPVPPVQEP
jgi:hypothetical protein